jgi:site-specific DNA recombinase
MLHNDRYCGTVIWNRTKKVRDPGTGRRVQRIRPRSEWTVVDAPHLRIVTDEIWGAVKNRLACVTATFSNEQAAGLCSRSYSARYLFSGFMKCGLCGSNIVLISGRGGVGWAKYGCPLHQNRGVCSNSVVMRRDRLEAELLSGLKREVIREDLAAFALDEFKRQLQGRLNDTRSHLSAMRTKREKLKTEIANLARVIANGHQSTALLQELGKRETELENISDELLVADGQGLDARFQEIETFVQKRLRDIRSLLDADVPRAKAELSKHSTAITITPEGSTYRIAGDWNLLGGRSDGAGGQNRTGYARLFRAALYH